LVKYLRFVGDMHPAEHALHDVKSVGEAIAKRAFLFCLVTLFVRSLDGI